MPDNIELFSETFISSLIIGIITIGSFFAIVMFFKFRQRDSKAYFFLSISAFSFVFFKLLSVYFFAVTKTPYASYICNLIQDYTVISIFFTLPYFLLMTFDQTKFDYKVLSWTTRAGAVLGPVLLAAVLIFHGAFIQFDGVFGSGSYSDFMRAYTKPGPLFVFRDIYLMLLCIEAAVLIIKKIALNQSKRYSIIMGIGTLCAIYFGVLAILKNYLELPAIISLGTHHTSHFIIGLGCFYFASLLSSTLSAVNKAIESRKLTLALQNSEQELLRLAYHDAHTGILNRKSFYSQLDTALEISRRSTHTERRAIILMDMDYFKEINDSYGHPAGDELIRMMVKRFQNSIRKSDMLFRLVGDEFAILVYNVSSIENIALMAQKLLLTLRNHFEIGEHSLYLSTSIGIAIFPDDGVTSEALLRNADYALYEAKKDRNTFKFYTSEMQRKAYERMSIINALRKSIKDEEFELYYQGLYDKNGNVAGAEALLRWNNPGWNNIPTDFFIMLAENSGLILELGKWVLMTAFKQLHSLSGFSENLYLSINLSIKQLRDENLIPTVENLENMYQIDASAVQFEITEGTFMENPEKIGDKLKILTGRGYRFAIDDFGTGFSSFHYLRTMPVSSLKIDKSFLIGIEENPDSKAMVTSMINMGHSMKMEITAEGVETEAQKNFLIESDCDYLQGFYLKKPLPINNFITEFNLDS